MTKKSKRKRSLICGKTFSIEDHGLEEFHGPILVKITKHIDKGKNRTYLKIDCMKVRRESMMTTEISHAIIFAMINWNINNGSFFFKSKAVEPKWVAVGGNYFPRTLAHYMISLGNITVERVKGIILENIVLGVK